MRGASRRPGHGRRASRRSRTCRAAGLSASPAVLARQGLRGRLEPAVDWLEAGRDGIRQREIAPLTADRHREPDADEIARAEQRPRRARAVSLVRLVVAFDLEAAIDGLRRLGREGLEPRGVVDPPHARARDRERRRRRGGALLQQILHRHLQLARRGRSAAERLRADDCRSDRDGRRHPRHAALEGAVGTRPAPRAPSRFRASCPIGRSCAPPGASARGAPPAPRCPCAGRGRRARPPSPARSNSTPTTARRRRSPRRGRGPRRSGSRS